MTAVTRKDRVLPLVNSEPKAKLSRKKSMRTFQCLSHAHLTARSVERASSSKISFWEIWDLLKIPHQKTDLPSTCWRAPVVGKRAPRDAHCQPDCGSESVPKHDHDARRGRHGPCVTQTTFLIRKHPTIDFGTPTVGQMSAKLVALTADVGKGTCDFLNGANAPVAAEDTGPPSSRKACQRGASKELPRPPDV